MASFLAKIIRSLKAPHPTIDSIDCFSDGASTGQAASANRSTGLFENVIFLQALYKVEIQRNFFKMAYGKGAIEGIGGDTKRVVAQVLVVGSCDDAFEIDPVKDGASPMCLHFPCQCGQVMDESNELE